MSYNITTVDMYDMTIQLERMSYNITTVDMYDITIQLERNVIQHYYSGDV